MAFLMSQVPRFVMSATKEERWLILVGIDFYLPGTRPINIKNLAGCVRDVNSVEEYFTNRLALPPSRIVKLTASTPQDLNQEEPTEPASKWPTYENIIAAIQQVTLDTSEGDSVYFHYSGHGGRVATLFESIKGKQSLDEVLVPTNIKRPEGQYLRDVELAALINDMIKKRLVVTVVLDSCHSAGATRLSHSGKPTVRGLDEIDLSTPQIKTSAIPYDSLVESWKQNRTGTLGESWLLEARGYTLLAACRANETAKEVLIDSETRGVFTYWLLNSLDLAWPQQTYQMLHNRVRAKVYSYNQTPVLAGEGDRIFFGIDRVKPIYSINVLNISYSNKEGFVVIDAGRAHGIHPKTELALYPRDVSDFTDLQRRIAIAEVIRVEDVRSTAKLTLVFDSNSGLETGYQAVVLRRNALHKKHVKLVEKPDLDASIDQIAALEHVRTVLESSGDILALNVEGVGDVDYQVSVNDHMEYEIWNSTGHLIPHVPVVKTDSGDAAEKLTKHLKHLVIYDNVRNLDNSDSTSLLVNKLEVRILGKLRTYDLPPDPRLGENNNPTSPLQLQAVSERQGLPDVVSGEWVIVRITNLYSKPVNITVLDLQPSWAITQIYPSTDGTDFETLDGGQYLDLPLQMTIPESLKLDANENSIVDTIKVFATIDSTSFLWLQLPDLDQDQERDNRSSQPQNSLEELEAAVTALQHPWRLASRGKRNLTKWTTEQVMIRTCVAEL